MLLLARHFICTDARVPARNGVSSALAGWLAGRLLPPCWPQVYPQVSPALVSRFREREESVKGDIFHAYVDLLRQASYQ
jgi:hypothetical protein